MKGKKLVALLLALLMVSAPVGNVYATGVDPEFSQSIEEDRVDPGFSQIPEEDKIDEGFAQNTKDDMGIIDPEFSQSTEDDRVDPGFSQTPEEDKIDEGFTQNPLDPDGKILFNHSMIESQSGWNTTSSDIGILFDFKFGVKSATVYYIQEGKDAQKTEVPVSLNDDGMYFAEIKGSELKDGVTTITAECVGVDNSVSNSIRIGIDATGATFDSVTASNLFISDGVGYYKGYFTLSGFADACSGLGKIVVNAESAPVEYTGTEPVKIDKDSKTITVVDKAGNSVTISVIDLLSQRGICQSLVEDNDLPIISIKDTGTGKVDVNGVIYYKSDVQVEVNVSDATLKSVSVAKNGVLLDNLPVNGTTAERVFSFMDNGEYSISVVASDTVGNSVEGSVSFVIDSIAPEKGTVQAKGTWVERNNTLYTTDKITLDGTPVDALSGVKSISVLKGSDVVSTSLPYDIAESGEYSIELEDYLGNKSTLSLSDITGTSAVRVVLDTELPIVSIDKEKTTAPSVVDDRGVWYSRNPVIVFSATDSNMKSVTAIVEVDGVQSTLYSGSDSVSNYGLDTRSLSGKNFKVIVSAEDYSGNNSSEEFSYYVDSLAPALKGIVSDTPSNEKGGNVYFNEPFSITVDANDEDFGSITYYLNGISNDTGVFSGLGSGEYAVKLSDGLGNETNLTAIGEACGWGSNKVIVNGTAPSIVMNKKNGAWLNNTFEYMFNVSSEVGIDRVTITVNGDIVVDELYNGVDVTEKNLSVDLSTLKPNKKFAYNTKVSVTDNSGLTTVESDIVYVDTVNPSVGTLKANGKVNFKDGKLYTNKPILIQGTPVDKGSGIKDVSVIKNDAIVGSVPYEITESGTYSVKVTDNVGNYSIFELSDLVGNNSSTVVVDKVSPRVSFDMEKTDAPVYKDKGAFWYDNNPTVFVNIDDDNLSSVSVVCYVDGVATTIVSEKNATGEYKLDTSFSRGKEFRIVATAVDKGGNTTKEAYVFYVDYDAPEISTLTATSSPKWREVDGYVYSKGVFMFSGEPMDKDSGVKSVTLYKNGKVVGDFNKTYLLDKESMSGNYHFVLEDNVGHKRVVQANELLGSKSSNLVIDLTSPVITRTDSNKETINGWYNYAPTFTYKVFDDNIKSYSVTVNGEEALKGTSSEKISLNTENFQNQNVNIVIKVVDKAGNESSYSYSYSQDNTPPGNIVVSAPNPSAFKGKNVYFNSPFELTVSADDNFHGNIHYYVNGTLVDNGKCLINESGKYSFEVKDGLGNSTGVISLKDYFGWSGNNIVIDDEAPVIESNRYNGAWVTGRGTYDISVVDNLGIDMITVTINGKEVASRKIDSVSSVRKSVSVDTDMAVPNSDGSFNVVVRAYDNSGLVTEWRDSVFVDNTVPSITEFAFDGYVNSVNSDGYSYFFNGSGVVAIHCEDVGYSSGISSLWTRLEGSDWVELPVKDGYATIKIPADYRGNIEAYTVDNVGLKSSIKTSVSVISETSETHKNNSSVIIALPDTPYKDIKGNPLYNDYIIADMTVESKWSGINSLIWGIGTLNSVSDFSSGELDRNIVTKFSQGIPLDGNANGLKVSAVMRDMSGYAMGTDAVFSIDKDAPVISVEYHSYVLNGHYKDGRTATIYIKERNFDPSLVTIGGRCGNLGMWVHDGGIWSCDVSFSEDADYSFTVDCVDLANNKASQYVSERFTVDKTSPDVNVSWNNTNSNTNFYNEERVATITVTERNFDPSLVRVEGGEVSGWSSSGDIHTAVVRYGSSGEYEMSVACSDVAGNRSTDTYSSGKFVVDLDKPKVEILGVSNGVSYKGNVEFIVKVSDTYINNETYVSLVGKTHKELLVPGQVTGQTATFSFSDFPENSDVDDIYTIRVVAKDMAGNMTEEHIAFSVNRFGSSYKFDNDNMLGHYLNNPEDIVISELNVDRLDTNKVSIIVTRDGREISLKDNWVTVTEEEVNSKFLYTYRISKDAFLEDGKYSVSVISQAMEGTKYASVAEQYDFIIDKTSPEVLVSGIQSGESYHEYTKTVTIDARDLSGIQSVLVLVNGVEIENISNEDGIYSFSIGESDSAQTVEVTVIDLAGNKTVVSIEDFILTSNTMVYLVNQTWFMIVVALIVFLIIVLLLLLLSSRRKDKDDEKEAMQASGELYRSSTSSTTGSSKEEVDN